MSSYSQLTNSAKVIAEDPYRGMGVLDRGKKVSAGAGRKRSSYGKLLVIALFFCQSLTAQSSANHSRLATFAQVWGFLKYYHPAASFQVDWDSTLLTMIPKVQKCHSQKDFIALMRRLYDDMPSAKLAATISQPHGDSVTHTYSVNDIMKMNIRGWLKKEFTRLYQFHIPDTSRYITEWYKQYHLDFILHTENTYDSVANLNESMRLLTLFRYWNSIRYFYPHKERIPHWGSVLHQYIPVFSAATDSASYMRAVQELVHELPDSHSFFSEKSFNLRYRLIAPFTLMYLDGNYIIRDVYDSLRRKFDYQPGDVIEGINGLGIKDIEREYLKSVTGTNELSLHRNIARELLAGTDSILSIKFRRGERRFTKTVELHSWPLMQRISGSYQHPLWEEKEPGIWYVRFCRIASADTLKQLFADIQHAKAVIWEMRDYPRFNVTTQLPNWLFDREIIVSRDANALASFPGTFVTRNSYVRPDTSSEYKIYKGRMIVLVDERTQSLAESIASMMSLRENTVVMGRQTAGTTGNITNLDLPGGITVSYTGVKVAVPEDKFIQGRGVKIDIPVQLSVVGIQREGDMILKAALKLATTY